MPLYTPDIEVKPYDHLVFFTSTNSPPSSKTPNDASGGFIPWSTKFARINTNSLRVPIACDVPMDKRLENLLGHVRKFPAPKMSYTFFCHGWATAIQHGLRTKHFLLPEVVALFRRVPFINLYACLTAQDRQNGFAATIARTTKAQVLAHATTGAANTNPYVVIFKDGKI